MRKLIVIFLAAVAVISVSGLAFAADTKAQNKVVAYYLHGNFRCVNCINFEKYSKEAIETNFRDAIASGKLGFQVVNIEDRGNEHYIADYQLYTKSLILSLVKDGKEVRYKNLEKIWQLARDKEKFIEYVTGEIKGFLQEVQ